MDNNSLFAGYKFIYKQDNDNYDGILEPGSGLVEDIPSYAPEWREHLENFGAEYTGAFLEQLRKINKESKNERRNYD